MRRRGRREGRRKGGSGGRAGREVSESVDSLCRDGTNTPIVRVHTKGI